MESNTILGASFGVKPVFSDAGGCAEGYAENFSGGRPGLESCAEQLDMALFLVNIPRKIQMI